MKWAVLEWRKLFKLWSFVLCQQEQLKFSMMKIMEYHSHDYVLLYGKCNFEDLIKVHNQLTLEEGLSDLIIWALQEVSNLKSETLIHSLRKSRVMALRLPRVKEWCTFSRSLVLTSTTPRHSDLPTTCVWKWTPSSKMRTQPRWHFVSVLWRLNRESSYVNPVLLTERTVRS